MSLDYKKNMIPTAKSLRKNMTPEEKHLWYDFLKNYPVRYQRQKTIGTYIVDFYCHKAKLVIEVDGIQHGTDENIIRDRQRTAFLERQGLEVLRFTNYDVNTDFDAVCEEIDVFTTYRIQNPGQKIEIDEP